MSALSILTLVQGDALLKIDDILIKYICNAYTSNTSPLKTTF